jgi:hypothetical protein
MRVELVRSFSVMTRLRSSTCWAVRTAPTAPREVLRKFRPLRAPNALSLPTPPTCGSLATTLTLPNAQSALADPKIAFARYRARADRERTPGSLAPTRCDESATSVVSSCQWSRPVALQAFGRGTCCWHSTTLADIGRGAHGCRVMQAAVVVNSSRVRLDAGHLLDSIWGLSL